MWDNETMVDYKMEQAKRQDIREKIEREQDHLKTIKDFIFWYLEKHKHTRNDLSPMSALNIAKIAAGCNEDYVIFNNGAHCVFDVWTNNVSEFVKYLETDGSGLYAYRIDGVNVIKNHPYIPPHHYEPQINKNDK